MPTLSHVAAELNGGAEALASASEKVSATAQTLSQASIEQAAGIEETTVEVLDIAVAYIGVKRSR